MADNDNQRTTLDDIPATQKDLSPEEAKNVQGGRGGILVSDAAPADSSFGASAGASVDAKPGGDSTDQRREVPVFE